MKKIIFTEEQAKFVKENYNTKTLKELAQILNVDLKPLRRLCEELGLTEQKKNPPRTVLTDEIQEKIKQCYANTRSTDICKMFNLNPSTLQEFATKNHLKKAKGLPRETGSNEVLTKEQKQYLVANYGLYSNEELSKMLNIEIKAIRAYACNMGLTKKKDVCSNIPNAFNFYMEKRNQPEYNVNDHLGKDQEELLPVKKLYKSSMGRYFVNKDYFEQIDSEWKAYWLGFLYADGCNDVSNWCVRLKLQKSDLSHVELFKRSVQSTAPIKSFYRESRIILNKKVSKGEYSEINVCNKKMCEDLIKQGCVPNKTYVLQFPSFDIVPEHLFRHFVRGFFDGDGWISSSVEKKMINIGFVGIESFIKPLHDYLIKTLQIENIKVKPQQDNAAVEMSWGGLSDCEKIYNFLYNDANIFLRRKLDKLDKILCLGQYEV